MIIYQKLEGSRDLGHAHFRESYLCARSDFSTRSYVPNLSSVAEVVLKICLIICQEFEGSRDLSHAPVGNNCIILFKFANFQQCDKQEVSTFAISCFTVARIQGATAPHNRGFPIDFESGFYHPLLRDTNLVNFGKLTKKL